MFAEYICELVACESCSKYFRLTLRRRESRIRYLDVLKGPSAHPRAHQRAAQVCACVCVRVEGSEKSADMFAEYVWGLVAGECRVHMLTKHFKGQRRLLIDWSPWGSPGESTLVVFRALVVCLLSCNCCFFNVECWVKQGRTVLLS